MSVSLVGKVAVVTGGAGGIGSAIARTLAGAGARLVITYHENAARAEALVHTLPGTDHLAAQASVEDSATLARLAEQLATRYGQLDILINNAGVTRPVPHADLDGLDDALIDRIFRVNVRGAFACVRAFRPLLTAGEGGLVVNVSSVAAQTGLGSNVAYCASKAALDSMTRSLARALAPQIRVLSIAPGWVDGEYASRMDPVVIEAQRRHTPLGRIARAEEVAEAVLAAATLLTFTTGCVIPVDGGRPLG
ncbi:MAG: SDR family NAD(P)-dependent oxidoreductase [Anaerolineales bacterium]